MSRKLFFSVAVLLCPVLLSGCATMIDGTRQSVSVEAHEPDNKPVVGADCKLTNNAGSWYVHTPGSVTVDRSHSPLHTECTREGFEPSSTTTKSSGNWWMLGNVIFGGLIGLGVDLVSGASSEYPPTLNVNMQPAPAKSASK